MEKQSFYGVTLTEKEPLAQFEVSTVEELDQKLVIKQILLGPEAKKGEFNVVQVEALLSEKEIIKIPIAVLKSGETHVLRPNIGFPGISVTFKLIQGSGPIHIHGQNIINSSESDEIYYEEEQDEQEK